MTRAFPKQLARFPSWEERKAAYRHVYAAYLRTLQRPPDEGGFRYFVDKYLIGMQIDDIDNHLIDSDEYRARTASSSEGPPEAGGNTLDFDDLDILAALYPNGIVLDDAFGAGWWQIVVRNAWLSKFDVESSPARMIYVVSYAPSRCEQIASLANLETTRAVVLVVPFASLFAQPNAVLSALRPGKVYGHFGGNGVRLSARIRNLARDDDLVCLPQPGMAIDDASVQVLLTGAGQHALLTADTSRQGKLEFDGLWNVDARTETPPVGIVAVRVAAALDVLPMVELSAMRPDWDFGCRTAESCGLNAAAHIPLPVGRIDLDPGGHPFGVKPHNERARSKASPEPEPSISIIIPTRERADLLWHCLEGLLLRTSYKNIQIVIIDNGSTNPETISFFRWIGKDTRVKIVHDNSVFNWSALNHQGVAHSDGDFLLFLNNDIVVIDPDWLSELVSQLLRDDVGIVGPKLLYPDGTIQHAGIAFEEGSAVHMWRHAPGESSGHANQLSSLRTVSAVTGACLAIRRSVYEQVGGFDLTNMPVTWGDVDLCLRVRAAGYRVVWTPRSVLYHVEQATRGSDDSPEAQDRYRRERAFALGVWGNRLRVEHYLSPNLVLGPAFARIKVRPSYLEA